MLAIEGDGPYRQMFEANPQPMWIYDLETLRFLAVNHAAVDAYGYSRDEFLAMTIKDIRPEEDVPALLRAVASVTTGLTPTQSWRHRRKSGVVFPVEITSHTIEFAGRQAELVMARDITARQQAEERIRHLNRVYAVLSDINQAIVRGRDRQSLLDETCRIAVDKGGFLMAWVGVVEPQEPLRIAAHAGTDAPTLAVLQSLIDADPPAGCAFTREALSGGECRICSDIARHPLAAPWRDAALERGYRSMAAFPLRAGQAVIGVLNLYAEVPGFFTDDEVALLEELAADISFSLEVVRRETVREAAEQRSARQREALIAIASRQMAAAGSLAQELREILEVTAETLGAARVSVWRYRQDRASIECVDLFDAGDGQHTAGAVLEARTHPAYFRALEREEVIAAEDALTDARTREFAEDYLKPAGIGAMLDVPTTVGGARDGVLCHEYPGGPRVWSEDEKTFAVAVGNLVSLALERDVRRTAEERFRELAETIEEVFWLTDPQKSRMLYLSPAYERIWGRSVQSVYDAPSSWLDAIHPDDRERIVKAVETEQMTGEYDEEYRIVRPDGAVRWIRDQAFPVRDGAGRVRRIVGVARDITERRDLERQFREAQRMEAVGQLAGGVAHDFNNILTAIQFNVSLLLSSEGVSAEIEESARDIERAVQRATGLTRQLLTFSRKQVMQARPLDLNAVVTDMTTMLRRIIGEDVVVDVRCAAGRLPLVADAGMLEQVLMNLAVNARDAMPSGGTVSIETSVAHVRHARHACLSVRDTGTGIPPDVKAKMFEPFFTTKGVGRGTGLGLAMVHGIVAQHRGFIEVDTAPGAGTTFKVYFPCADVVVEADQVAAPPAPWTTHDGGGRTILVVEDEPSVRQLVKTILVRAGYQVLLAEHGAAALVHLAAHKPHIALVITDIVMPEGITGVDVAREVERQIPGCPVIFTSGYAPQGVTRQVVLTEGVNFLAKPLAAGRLLDVVRRRLSERSRS